MLQPLGEWLSLLSLKQLKIWLLRSESINLHITLYYYIPSVTFQGTFIVKIKLKHLQCTCMSSYKTWNMQYLYISHMQANNLIGYDYNKY